VAIDGGEGLVTGYYEPVFEGSQEPTEEFSAPVLGTPEDLISVDLGAFRPELRGKRIAGQVKDGRLVPYADRKAIEEAPPGSANVLGYMRPDDLFFLQIQGSGVLQLPETARRIGYASQNGHIYVAIGKTLIDEGELAREDVTMQSIRAWLDAVSPKTRPGFVRPTPLTSFSKTGVKRQGLKALSAVQVCPSLLGSVLPWTEQSYPWALPSGSQEPTKPFPSKA